MLLRYAFFTCQMGMVCAGARITGFSVGFATAGVSCLALEKRENSCQEIKVLDIPPKEGKTITCGAELSVVGLASVLSKRVVSVVAVVVLTVAVVVLVPHVRWCQWGTLCP